MKKGCQDKRYHTKIGFDLVIEEICNVATKLDISQNDLEKLDELTAYFQ